MFRRSLPNLLPAYYAHPTNLRILRIQCQRGTGDGRPPVRFRAGHNSGPSESPLTRQFWVPSIVENSSDIWNLHLAAKYLDKTFNAFDEKALGLQPSSKVHDWIGTEIEARFSSSHAEGRP